jgi:hypothetical protein
MGELGESYAPQPLLTIVEKRNESEDGPNSRKND